MPTYAPAAYGNYASTALSYNATVSAPVAETKSSFPPPFDTHGGAYVFQAQSGCFFEPLSAHYYCPKSKLYYNSLEGTYFRYSPGSDPPFVAFTPPLPFEQEPVAAPVDLEAPRKPVILSLGTKSSKPKVPVKLTQDISKWNERQKELAEASSEKKSEEEVPELKIPVFAAEKSEGKDMKDNISACLLCRRQFKTTEQLSRHEKESKLHAENLAKKAAEEVKYRDRASERRAMHGTASVPILDRQVERPLPIGVQFVPMMQQPLHASSAVPISEGNTGNALLRKLGWEGEGLGRDNQGIAVPVGLEEPKQDRGGLGSSTSSMQTSWEHATTEDYRRSVRDAARARFNDLQS